VPIDTFSSVLAKLGRGGQHCESLKEAIAVGIFARDGYATLVDRDGDSPDVLHRGQFKRIPPLAQWGAMFGDVIHCHRSALDNLAWHLTCTHSGPPPADPIPRKNPWRDVAFPIVLDRTHWASQCKLKLWGVDPDALAVFESAQPFATHDAQPDTAPLAILEQLWVMDKHRRIHFVDVTVWPDWIRLTWKGTDTPVRARDIAKWTHKWRPGAHNDGAPLIAQRLLEPLSAHREREVEVDRSLTADVSLPQGPPAFGQTVLALVAEQNRVVREVIQSFHRHLGYPADHPAFDEWDLVSLEVAPPPSRIPPLPTDDRG
jgi:hypothetical protein